MTNNNTTVDKTEYQENRKKMTDVLNNFGQWLKTLFRDGGSIKVTVKTHPEERAGLQKEPVALAAELA